MPDEAIDRRVRASRYHICCRCRRPVEACTVKMTARGWHVIVRCHGDVQETLLSASAVEDNAVRMFWFDEYRELDAPKIPSRIDVHLHVHLHEEKDNGNE